MAEKKYKGRNSNMEILRNEKEKKKWRRVQEIYLKVSSSLQSLIIVVYYFVQYQRRTTLSAWYNDFKYVSP